MYNASFSKTQFRDQSKKLLKSYFMYKPPEYHGHKCYKVQQPRNCAIVFHW